MVTVPAHDVPMDDDAFPALNGRACVFGDQVSRRQILADAYLVQPAPPDAAEATTALHPDFRRRITRGDFLVAGVEFAADVSERAVPLALKAAGVAAVIARSFGHFFVRNAINTGLPAVVVEETPAIKSGDRLRVDVEAHIVANLSSGDRYVIRNIDEDALSVLRAGGIVAHAQRRHTPSS